ncbi:MAG: hypothetical protein GX657_18580 [Chloroflexi bacterium]|jgi:putative FmdB family regulatory protein|nr:hypothetical protein [Chloroflexota bacterium]
MPTYGYKCEECGVTFERFQHFSEDPIKTCPECSGPVRRVIFPVGIVFKGSGFYVTDNRAGSSTALPGKKNGEADAAPAAEKGSSSPADKPASKAAAES